MKGSSKYTFSQVPKVEIPRSMFSRSHQYKTTFDSGYLIPFYVDEALPGDTFNCRVSLFARLATPIVPILDNIYLDVFFFAVPNRLVWDNWQKFCGEKANPTDTTDYLVPVVNSGSGFSVGSMGDYFGLPVNVANITASALFFRGYNLIYNEWFRDQNLQSSLSVPKGDGPDSSSTYALKRRGKRHDYFTSCLPWPQKGPGVNLPLSGYADVVRDASGTKPGFEATLDGSTVNPLLKITGATVGAPTGLNFAGVSGKSWQAQDVLWGANVGLKADLGTTSAVTINTMREAFQIQKLLERDARGGTRYVEIVKSHFGVTSPDARLQRPEYLGGGTIPVIITPVAQTAQSTEAPMGALAAYGTAVGNSHGFSKSFVEHSVIIGLVSARADLTYQQGLPRQFSRRTRYDFYWPALAHLGEQAVKQKEIYCDGTSADESVFGYQERWAEYRYFPSQITGKFRSNISTPVDIWHLAQKFDTAPTLSSQFIEENPPISRVVAVLDEPQFYFDSYIQVKCARPMPMYSVPGLVDHF